MWFVCRGAIRRTAITEDALTDEILGKIDAQESRRVWPYLIFRQISIALAELFKMFTMQNFSFYASFFKVFDAMYYNTF